MHLWTRLSAWSCALEKRQQGSGHLQALQDTRRLGKVVAWLLPVPTSSASFQPGNLGHIPSEDRMRLLLWNKTGLVS